MPLVILEGARATSKTELVRHAVEQGWLSDIRSFLDPADLGAANAAPRDFVFGLSHGTAIDEAQLCEQILLPVKERIEAAGPGALLLTGSTRLRRDELGGSDPLAGRVGQPLHLGPLTLGERRGDPKQLVEQLFEGDPLSISVGAPITRTGLIELVQEPGLPGLVTSKTEAREELSQAYIAQTTTQSRFDSVDVHRVNQLARHLAGRTSTMVNVSNYGQAVELHRSSVDKYLAHLEEAILLVRLPGWRRSKDKSETDRPKLHFFDAGVAAATARMLPDAEDDHLGRLTETLLVTDLMRQSQWLDDPPACYHWRRSNQHEVDLVLEVSDGRAVCIEVKVAEKVDVADFRGIDEFRRRHGYALYRGFVFYSGRNVQSFGDDRWALPFSALLTPETGSSEAPVVGARRPTRESTFELWERVLPRLIALTRSQTIDWQDDAIEAAYIARTDAGTIRMARRFPSSSVVGTPLDGLINDLGQNQSSMTIYDPQGSVVADLEAQLQQAPFSALDTNWVVRATRLSAIHRQADELLMLIEQAPNVASRVADNILDELGPA